MGIEEFQKIDRLIESVNQYKIEDKFSKEIESRKNRNVPKVLTNKEILEVFSTLIAFSQNAKSNRVKEVIDGGVFQEIFQDFDINKMTKMNPCDLVDKYWDKIKGIRQQTKIFHIISLARKIHNIDSFSELLTENMIPKRIKTEEDIKQFWVGFSKLKKVMNANKVPFFRSTTSLLHFLLEMGYDCAKPDSAVMKVAVELGIVEEKKGEKNFVKAIQTIQEYSLDRRIRPSVIDLYFLIAGGQLEAKSFVEKEFYLNQQNSKK